ncbi:MAG TPA: hypothetical protein VLM79_05010 [Kofleriaceae bacterium]|nr:hypothetical protein [Kofleriaceae bacterium]
MLSTGDVVDLMREDRAFLRKAAVLAGAMCAVLDRVANGRCDLHEAARMARNASA